MPESGAAAEPGRWTIEGGCAARTGSTRTAPLLERPEVAWRHALRGTLESEPLVWDERVLLAVCDTPTRRSLLVLDLESGTVLLSQALPATQPLAPALWGSRVAVRPEPDRIEVFRVDGRRLRPFRTLRGHGVVSAPLILDDELYLREGDELVRYDLDRNEPVWRIAAPEASGTAGVFRGTPSVRGAHVYALSYDREGRAELLALRRADGAVVDRAAVGFHGGELPAVDAEVLLAVHAREVFVRHALPVAGSRGEEYGVSRTTLEEPGRFRADGTTLHHLDTLPVDVGPVAFLGEEGAADPTNAPSDAWVALAEAAGERARWIAGTLAPEGVLGLVLADRASHAALLERPPPAAAQGLLYFGELAVDAHDWAILWRLEQRPRLRPVPARDALLVVSGAGELICLRTPSIPADPLAERVADVRREAARNLAEGYALLATEALRTNDPGLLRRFVEEAERRGATSRGLASARAGLERLEASGRVLVGDPRRVQALEARERELRAAPAQGLLARARAAGPGPEGRAFARAVLDEAPDHAGAAELVGTWLAPELPRTSPLPAASWLDFLDATARAPVRYVAPGSAGDAPARPLPSNLGADELRRLEAEVQGWRPDVGGYASERLFVISAPGRPGAVARSLEVGEYLCDVLEEVFAPLGPPAAGTRPLTLLLYESRERYLEQSRRGHSLPEAALGWTAGHYNPAEQVSRMFVPDDDRDARRLLKVYAHELTHHWIDARSPLKRSANARAPEADVPGFWIVEGFASLVQEFRLDLERRTWSAPDPRAGSLDLLANAPAEVLLPWSRVFAASHAEFATLDAADQHQIPLAWTLGATAPRSEIHLFYAQAGAVCHYLFEADAGARREALLAYYAARERGERAALDVERAFGLSAEELGRRAREYAKAVLGEALGGR